MHEKSQHGKSLSRIRANPIAFTAGDGVRLHGTWFLPPIEEGISPRLVVVITCGGGIRARFYHGLARHLGTCNAAVLTFDYRGIGASRQGTLRGMSSGVDVWGAADLDAALRLAHNTFPSLPVSAIAHSVGALLLGAAKESRWLSKIVFLGPHTGYWRDYGRRWRLPLYFTWHVFMPMTTKIFGYFPGKVFRLGEDLPPQVAMDWANRRHANLVDDRNNSWRLRAVLQRYGDVRASILSLSASDDAFAPPEAARRLLELYPNVRATVRMITPESVNSRRVGHFGYLRRPASESIWRMIAEWLTLADSERGLT